MVAATDKQREKEKRLTFLGHLQEIRRRLVYCVIALIITVAVAFFFTDRIIDFLRAPAEGDARIIFTEVTEMFSVWFKVCLYSALVMALPFFVLQIVLFIRLALTGKERAYLYLLMPSILLFFAGGAAFAWYVFLPQALDFLLKFGGDQADAMIKIGSLISFEVQILFWNGRGLRAAGGRVLPDQDRYPELPLAGQAVAVGTGGLHRPGGRHHTHSRSHKLRDSGPADMSAILA